MEWKNFMNKPDYRVPSMKEIKKIPWNGYNVVSTFAGGGGSSTGYRMAGFKVLWASEFIDSARETYRANMGKHTILDGRDIREVSAKDILEAIKMNTGELDVLDGSPPCASFSTAGKRESGWGKIKKYSDKAQRTDDLFFEYSRLLRDLQPKVFVAENVSGLVKGTAKGYFKRILTELKSCGYRVSCRVLDAQWLGVPQARQRTIFIGVREDLGIDPVHPKPLPYRYVIKDCLSGIKNEQTIKLSQKTITYLLWKETAQGDNFSKAAIKRTGKNGFFNQTKLSYEKPAPTITASIQQYHWNEPRKLSIPEVRRICSFPDDFLLYGDFAKQWERMGRSVPPVMMSHIAATIRDEILAKCAE